MKKYLKYTILVLIIAALAAAAYYFFFRDREALPKFVGNLFPGSEKVETAPAAPKEVPEPKLQSLNNFPIFDYWIDDTSGDFYYLTLPGQVVRESGGKLEVINSQTINRLNQIRVSRNGKYALAKFNYPNLPTFSIFNIATESWSPLPENTIAAAFSPDSQRLVYANNKSLNILNLTTQKTSKIINLEQKELNLDWISDNKVLLSTSPAVDVLSSIWSFNLSNKRLTPMLEDEQGLVTRWFKDSDLGLRLLSIKRKPFLSLIEQDGSVINTFNFITMPGKCLINRTSVYCAVPKNIPDGINLPDDYYKKSIYFDDSFYEINLSGAGVFDLSVENQDITIDAQHLEVYSGRLYFKNRLDDRLYSLRLGE